MLEKLKKFGWGLLIIGITLIGIGISFIVFSNALTALAIAVGITLTVFGILLAVFTLRDTKRGISFFIRMALSIAAIIGGIITLIMRTEAIGVITDICCLLLMIDGAFKLNTAITKRRIGLAAFIVMMTLALVTIIPSFIVTKLLTASPDSSVLSVVIGIIIILDGIGNLITPFLPDESEEKKEYGKIEKSYDKPDKGGDREPERYLER